MEKAEQCVYVHIDDTWVKEQTQHRDKQDAAKVPDINQKDATKDKLSTIQNTIARIKHTGKGFIL